MQLIDKSDEGVEENDLFFHVGELLGGYCFALDFGRVAHYD